MEFHTGEEEMRFGKKKEDKGAKGDQKGNSKHGTLKEEDLEKMKEERERFLDEGKSSFLLLPHFPGPMFTSVHPYSVAIALHCLPTEDTRGMDE
ncbi:UNVERIFIED_CONTAM: hypothetical protein K2H54_047626 [Gekko kuhli]